MLVVVFLFVGALVSGGIVDGLFSTPMEPLVGVNAVAEVEARATAQLSDGTRMRLLESDLRRSSRVRDAVQGPWGSLLYGLGGTLRREVVVGKDGWLFFRERVQPHEQCGPREIRELTAAFAALARRCEAQGTHLVLAPVPDKALVCAEQLPDGFDVSADGYRALVQDLRARGLSVADLLTALGEHAGQSFMRTDTHWTPQGARVAAECIARTAELALPDKEWIGRIVADQSVQDVGDLLRQTGIRMQTVAAGGLQQSLLDFGGRLQHMPMEHVEFSAGALRDPDLKNPWIVVGTSFSASGHYAESLARCVGERPIVRSLAAVTAAVVIEQLIADLALAESIGVRPRVAILEFLATDVLHNRYSTREVLNAQRDPSSGYREVPPEWGLRFADSARLKPGEITLDAKGVEIMPVSNTIFHPADGCLVLQIDGAVLSGSPRFSVRVGESTAYYPWAVERTHWLLPLTGGAPTRGFNVRLSAAQGASVRIDRVRLMTPLAPQAQAAQVGAVVAADGGFLQEVQYPAESGAMPVLFLELDTLGAIPAALRFVGGEQEFQCGALQRKARALLPLPHAWSGTMRITGAPPVPKRLVQRAGVLIQSRRG